MPGDAAGQLVLAGAPSQFSVGLARLLDQAEPDPQHQAPEIYGSPGGEMDLDRSSRC